MTCIAGLVDGKKVYIGGDSAGVGDYSLTVRADKKVFRNGDFVMGFCGSFRVGQLLRYSFEPPAKHINTDIDEFMVTDFIDAVRDCLKSGGAAEKKDEVESGELFMVGYQGRLFRIDSDYQIGESVHGFEAIGCGSDLALGSLYSTTGKPRERLKMALLAAESFSAGVRGPFHFEEI